MKKQLLEKLISETVKEVFSGMKKPDVLIPPGDVERLAGWLETEENWDAARQAFSTLKQPKESDLVDFVKAHRVFDDWSWNQVKDGIEKANEMDLMESFQNLKFQHLVRSVIKETIEEMDSGDKQLQRSVAFQDVEQKINASRDPQLIQTFAMMAKRYKDLLSTPKNLSVISKAVDTAAQDGRWKDLEKWFVTQVVKSAGKPLQEFVLAVKK